MPMEHGGIHVHTGIVLDLIGVFFVGVIATAELVVIGVATVRRVADCVRHVWYSLALDVVDDGRLSGCSGGDRCL